MTKIQFCFFMLCLFILHALVPGRALANDDPLPPTELLDWLDYALKRFPPEDCPTVNYSQKICAAVTEVEFRGDLKSGRIQAVFTGYNWSRQEQIVDLIGPSSSIVLENYAISLNELMDPNDNHPDLIAPFFSSTAGTWKMTVPPGKFQLTTDLLFDTKSVLPLTLAQGVGRVLVSGITGGFVQFDDESGNHGGEIQFVFEGEQQDEEEKPQVRVTRVFQWGSIPTFTYMVQVSGLRNELPIDIPLIADEVIEETEPDKPYTTIEKNGKTYIQTTFSATLKEIRIKGHYKVPPESFVLSDDLPFEIWVHLSDKRFPVQIDTDAKPVDPEEFSGMVDVLNARSFMVRPGEKLAFHAIDLNIDEGRKGSGTVEYNLFEGAEGYWLEKMFLNAKIAGQDRLVIPTPAAPSYAGIGQEGIELFHDENKTLSVRLPQSGIGTDQIIEVNWNNNRDPVTFFSLFKAEFPAQHVYMDKQDVTINFRPGVVPIIAFGGETTSGDLLDQFHLYGFLIGILAFFLCRGLKFSWPLSILVTVLFIGLYRVEQFPTSSVILLFFATLPIVQIGEVYLQKVVSTHFRKRLLMLVWLIFFISAIVPLSQYGTERVFSALHPYAGLQSSQYDSGTPQSQVFDDGYGRQMKKADYSLNIGSVANTAPAPEAMMMQKTGSFAGGASINKRPNVQMEQKLYQAGEWKAKPVSMDAYTRGNQVKLTKYNIADGQTSSFSIWLAGPLLRGVWMLFETALIICMVVALLSRARRLFSLI